MVGGRCEGLLPVASEACSLLERAFKGFFGLAKGKIPNSGDLFVQ